MISSNPGKNILVRYDYYAAKIGCDPLVDENTRFILKFRETVCLRGIDFLNCYD